LGLSDQGKIDVPSEIEKIKAETTDGKEIYRRIKELKAKALAHRRATKKLDLNGREWLEGDGAAGYLFDMIFSQVYASYNRTIIGSIIRLIVEESGGKDRIDQVETVHNFIDFNDFIIRKGAIRSYTGERMIIPFNMRDGILVCEGKSNAEWNCSAPHGAGRVMSRAQAKKRLELEEFKSQMEGVFSTSVCPGTLDEAPGAYKDASVIEQAIEPTATIVNRIKPVHNMKDTGEKSYRKRREDSNVEGER
jgi:RNA-splicing ligase RtcB